LVAVAQAADDTVVVVAQVVWLLSGQVRYRLVAILLTEAAACHKVQQTETMDKGQHQSVSFTVLRSILLQVMAAAVAELTQTIEQDILAHLVAAQVI
jgi:hypothetical protein